MKLPWFDVSVRAKRIVRLPVVSSREAVLQLLVQLQGNHWLMATVLYGAGLRLVECLRLSVKNVDLTDQQIPVGDGKGRKDCVSMLPESAVQLLQAQLGHAKRLHELGLRKGVGEPHLPHALSRKYPPGGFA
ncbi:MAG: tyrosine-type recombinase/integrase [Betaproteobacteria bacterium]|jgi:integrase|nr:MAG: tyrosine-type recombinase/integrase [Betaproteobacteria bacterium]